MVTATAIFIHFREPPNLTFRTLFAFVLDSATEPRFDSWNSIVVYFVCNFHSRQEERHKRSNDGIRVMCTINIAILFGFKFSFSLLFAFQIHCVPRTIDSDALTRDQINQSVACQCVIHCPTEVLFYLFEKRKKKTFGGHRENGRWR